MLYIVNHYNFIVTSIKSCYYVDYLMLYLSNFSGNKFRDRKFVIALFIRSHGPTSVLFTITNTSSISIVRNLPHETL